MDVVSLPLVEANLSVGDALARLERWQRAGLVVRKKDDDYRLHYIGALAKARDEDEQLTVGEIDGGHELLIVGPEAAAQFGLDLIRPRNTWLAYESTLDQRGRNYVLVGETDDAVMVVTRSEDYARDLNSGGYRCTGSPRHYFPEPRVNLGETCPFSAVCGAESTIVNA